MLTAAEKSSFLATQSQSQNFFQELLQLTSIEAYLRNPASPSELPLLANRYREVLQGITHLDILVMFYQSCPHAEILWPLLDLRYAELLKEVKTYRRFEELLKVASKHVVPLIIARFCEWLREEFRSLHSLAKLFGNVSEVFEPALICRATELLPAFLKSITDLKVLSLFDHSICSSTRSDSLKHLINPRYAELIALETSIDVLETTLPMTQPEIVVLIYQRYTQLLPNHLKGFHGQPALEAWYRNRPNQLKPLIIAALQSSATE
jgi:hypothetical protein